MSHKQDEITKLEQTIGANYSGNHTKSLHLFLRDSLKNLRTDCDYTTNVEELMQALDAVVKWGEVLHLGISDAPVWVVVKANAYATFHALARFSVIGRDMECEIVPMCIDEGLAIAPWCSAGQGRFKMKEEEEERKLKNEVIRSYTADSAWGVRLCIWILLG
ncbi:hypothetical protein ARMSODRAFT_973190 [Armillaria solidipes]|uniref:NADP-dependent oxidoreductase domain-containing protein n=1 Tax=Armillaria solidipes TaxID=1076256 RepID=A0A2H3BZR5_9AGAR|nr:hypothetical protein ARMSODRAFT_973190 [Armillaria solidipes]